MAVMLPSDQRWTIDEGILEVRQRRPRSRTVRPASVPG